MLCCIASFVLVYASEYSYAVQIISKSHTLSQSFSSCWGSCCLGASCLYRSRPFPGICLFATTALLPCHSLKAGEVMHLPVALWHLQRRSEALDMLRSRWLALPQRFSLSAFMHEHP